MAQKRKKQTVASVLLVLVMAGLGYVAKQMGWLPTDSEDTTVQAGRPGATDVAVADGGIGQLFRDGKSDVIVEAAGRIEKILSDDNDGSRHQRLIVQLYTGHTVLISHNIDLAPRVPATEGQQVHFRGEYEWNDRGGVIHWTHADPKKWREGGWIEVGGKRYE